MSAGEVAAAPVVSNLAATPANFSAGSWAGVAGRVVQQMPQAFWIEPLGVRLVEGSGPLAKAAQELQRRYPGGRVIPYGGPRLGEVSIEGAYIYPPVAAPIQ